MVRAELGGLVLASHDSSILLFLDTSYIYLTDLTLCPMMEAEERPMKKRKLSQDDPNDVNVTIQSEEGSDIQRSAGEKNNEFPLPTGNVQESNEDAVEDGLPPPDEVAPLAGSIKVSQDRHSLSKSQQKKLFKKLEWESKREERKIIRKEKVVAKRERRRATREQHAAENDGQPPLQPVKKPEAQKPAQLPVTFLIDCDFDDLMRDNERISLAAQITRSYSDNKNSMFRAHLTVCSFGGKLRERFDNILTHYKGWRGVRFLDCDFVEAGEKAKEWMLSESQDNRLAGTFSRLADAGEETQAKVEDEGEVVYLTSEADETLNELKPYSTYIIGGLVDKNREKGICYKRATKRGVRTARLPIGEFMDMQSRKVLATNHVNEIMLKWLECGDWGEAFVKVIPKRKGGKLRGEETRDMGDGDGVRGQVGDDPKGVAAAKGGLDEENRPVDDDVAFVDDNTRGSQ